MKGILSFIDLDKTECVDDLTLKVGFKQPTAYSLLAFSWSVGFIFNKAWFGSWRRGGHVQ
jgi:ABC-type transport system substrate-binding protein